LIARSASELLHRAREKHNHIRVVGTYLYYIVDVIKEKKYFTTQPTGLSCRMDYGHKKKKNNNNNTLTGMGTPVQAKSHWSQESGYYILIVLGIFLVKETWSGQRLEDGNERPQQK